MTSYKEIQLVILKEDYAKINKAEADIIQKHIMSQILELVERFDGNITLEVKLLGIGNS